MGVCTLPGMPNPWAWLREHHQPWDVRLMRLPDGLLGCTDPDEQVILIDDRLTQAQRRSVLAHEAIHVRDGDRGPQSAAREDEVNQEAARWLLPLEDLERVLPASPDRYVAAAELHVSVAMLITRVEHMHPAEVGALRRAFAACEHAA